MAIVLHRVLPGFANAEQVGRIIEGAEVVSRVKPVVIQVLMTGHAVLIIHQDLGRDKLTVSRSGGRGEKVLFTLGGTDREPLLWLLPVHGDHATDKQQRA